MKIRNSFFIVLVSSTFLFNSTLIWSQENVAGLAADAVHVDKYIDIDKEEEILMKAKDELVKNKMTAADLYQRLEQGKDQSGFKNYIQQWQNQQMDFQKKLDHFTVNQLDHFMNETHDVLNDNINTLTRTILKYPKAAKKLYKGLQEINRDLQVMNQSYQDYHQNKDQYGQAKDKLRMYPYRDFFKIADKIAFKIETLLGKRNLKFTELSDKDKCVSKKPSMFKHLNLIGKGLCILPDLLFPSKKAKENNTPLVTKFDNLYRKFGDNLGYNITVEGKENIPAANPDQPKRIVILAGSHRDEEADAVAITHLGIQDHLIFFAAYNVLPQFLAKLVDQSHDILVVGGDKEVRKYDSPLDKLFEKLEAGVSQTFIIFPQGSTSLINEVHPARAKSTWEALIKKGYEVVIVPFTIDTDLRLLSQSRGVDDKNVTVKISPAITPEMYQSIYDVNHDHQFMNYYLRALWSENILTHHHLSNSEFTQKIGQKIYNRIPSTTEEMEIMIEKKLGLLHSDQLAPEEIEFNTMSELCGVQL